MEWPTPAGPPPGLRVARPRRHATEDRSDVHRRGCWYRLRSRGLTSRWEVVGQVSGKLRRDALDQTTSARGHQPQLERLSLLPPLGERLSQPVLDEGADRRLLASRNLASLRQQSVGNL